ncbi:MAG: 30S ribosomal protein S6, partial [Desulfobulbaceae bacterium]|nr:30S ribosomal protein S6 [Desulfobulbaceae bacterium]
MRRYETIYIIRSNTTEDDIDATIAKANGIIENFGGTVLNVNKWGLKKLAYLIKKESQGYYVHTEYAGVPKAVDEIERVFRIDDTILKYLTVKLQDTYIPDEPASEESEDTPENEAATAETTDTPEAAAATAETTDTPEAAA